MIFESSFWKEDLIKLATQLEKRYNQKRWSERSLATVEKKIFIGFYMVRKLIEAKKISDSLRLKKISLIMFPIKDTKINWHLKDYWDRLYNLGKGQKTELILSELCNQFIHSYIFSPYIPIGGSLIGFYFCSDWSKNKQLYYIPLSKVADIFKSIGKNYPYKSRVTFNKKTGEYDIFQE